MEYRNGDMKITKKLPDIWWEKNSVITRVNPRHGKVKFKEITDMLDDLKSWGSGAIEIFAPYYGFGEYEGLDVIDYYSVDPEFGSFKDFLELVEACHEKEIAIVVFMNMGYSAMNHPAFIQACIDKGKGIDSKETHYFVWSDTDKKTMDRSLAPHFMNDEDGHWQYHDVAKCFYWVKWRGVDKNTDLPQFNFGDPVWQEECIKSIKFWMDTGVDGMVIDAVNWYINCNWEINNKTMTDIVSMYGNKFIQPEGAGGFNDDPVPWIKKGGYNCVQDYGSAIWWNDHDVIGKAIETGLRSYRDKVVEAGGVTYLGPNWKSALQCRQRILEIAVLASVGEMFLLEESELHTAMFEQCKNELKRILCAMKENAAFYPASSRIQLSTNDDNKYYAFIRESSDKLQRILVVLNFQSSMEQVEVFLHGRHKLTDVFTDEQSEFQHNICLTLQPYGYQFFSISEVRKAI